MRRKNAYIAIKTVIFLVVGILLYQEVNAVFVEKSTYGRYLNFKHMENVDLLILGSSHSDNGIGAGAVYTHSAHFLYRDRTKRRLCEGNGFHKSRVQMLCERSD